MQAAIAAVQFCENRIDAGAVADFEFTSQGVGHQFFGQAAAELVLSIGQKFPEFRNCPKRSRDRWEIHQGTDANGLAPHGHPDAGKERNPTFKVRLACLAVTSGAYQQLSLATLPDPQTQKTPVELGF